MRQLQILNGQMSYYEKNISNFKEKINFFSKNELNITMLKNIM